MLWYYFSSLQHSSLYLSSPLHSKISSVYFYLQYVKAVIFMVLSFYCAYSRSRTIHSCVWKNFCINGRLCAAAFTYPYSSYLVLSLPNMDLPDPPFLRNLTIAMDYSHLSPWQTNTAANIWSKLRETCKRWPFSFGDGQGANNFSL